MQASGSDGGIPTPEHPGLVLRQRYGTTRISTRRGTDPTKRHPK